MFEQSTLQREHEKIFLLYHSDNRVILNYSIHIKYIKLRFLWHLWIKDLNKENA